MVYGASKYTNIFLALERGKLSLILRLFFLSYLAIFSFPPAIINLVPMSITLADSTTNIFIKTKCNIRIYPSLDKELKHVFKDV